MGPRHLTRSNIARGKKYGERWQNFSLATVPSGKRSGDSIWIKYETIDIYQPSNRSRKPIRGKFHLITDISEDIKFGYKEGIYKITGKSIKDNRGNSLKKRERIFFPSGYDEPYIFSIDEEKDYNVILENQKETWERDKDRFDFSEKNPLSVGSLVYFKPETPQSNEEELLQIAY